MDTTLLQLLLVQGSVIAVIVFVFKMISSRDLNNSLARLRELQEETLIKEEQLKEELEKAKQERFAEIEKGRQQAKRILEEAKKDASTAMISLEDQSKLESQKILDRGKEELEKLKANLLSEIQSQALIFSTEMIELTFSEQGKESLQHQFIEEIIKEINAIDKSKFSVSADRIKVITSFPLNPEERQHLTKVLSTKIENDFTLDEQLDKKLITGLIVEIGALVLDGSLKNKLSKAIPYIKAHRERMEKS